MSVIIDGTLDSSEAEDRAARNRYYLEFVRRGEIDPNNEFPTWDAIVMAAKINGVNDCEKESFAIGKAEGFTQGYADGYEAATRSERFASDEDIKRLYTADEDLRIEISKKYRCYDESDSTPCWDDIIKAVFEAGIEEAAWRNQGPR